MGFSFSIRRRFQCLPGEEVLQEIRNVKFVSSKALPSYRWAFRIPLFMRLQLCVTDRRIILLVWICGFLVQDFYCWYPVHAPADDREVIRKVDVGDWGFLGKCLLVVSHNPTRMKHFNWLASPTLEVRYYTRSAEALRSIIVSQMA